MPYRSPQEKGTRREWSRRFGHLGFPQAEGIRKQGSPGSIKPTQFRHLENVRYDDPDVVSRGGQAKLFLTQQTGCIQGIFEVAGGSGIYVAVAHPALAVRLYRYDPSKASPAIFNLLLSGLQDIAVANTAVARRALVAADGKLFGFAELATAQSADLAGLFEIIVPEDGESLADTKLKRVLDLTQLPQFSSAVAVQEMVAEKASDLSDDNLRSVLYVGAETDGKVRRWDGVSVTEDSPNLGAGRQIVFAYADTVWAAGTSYLARRDGPSLWTAVALPGGLTLPFIPTAAVAYGASAYLAGLDTTAVALGTGPAVILEVTAPSTVTIKRRPTGHWNTNPPVPDPTIDVGGNYVSDVTVLDNVLHYLWMNRNLGGSLQSPCIGKFDGATFTDTIALKLTSSGESGGLAASGGRLYAGVGDTGFASTLSNETLATLADLFALFGVDTAAPDIVVF